MVPFFYYIDLLTTWLSLFITKYKKPDETSEPFDNIEPLLRP